MTIVVTKATAGSSVRAACLDLAVGLLRHLFKAEALTTKILAGTARSSEALGTILGLPGVVHLTRVCSTCSLARLAVPERSG
jgi:hypothetical protein